MIMDGAGGVQCGPLPLQDFQKALCVFLKFMLLFMLMLQKFLFFQITASEDIFFDSILANDIDHLFDCHMVGNDRCLCK